MKRSNDSIHVKNRITIFSICLIVVIILLTYFIKSENSSTSENRTMATFSMVFHPSSDSIVYRESAIERFEEAMKDQFFFRKNTMSLFLTIKNSMSDIIITCAKSLSAEEENEHFYEEIGDYIRIDGTDWITNKPDVEQIDYTSVKPHIDQIKNIHSKYMNIQFYVYFVTQAYETAWFDDFLGFKVPDKTDKIFSLLPDYVKKGRMLFDDFEDYQSCHYKSDHHWNANGARRGYENIYDMMKTDLSLSRVLTPVSEIDFSSIYDFKYKGSYANSLQDLYDGYDEFSVFEYDLPRYSFNVINPDTDEEIPVKQCSLWKEYRNGEINTDEYTDHYITFYGNAEDSNGNRYADSRYIFHIINTELNGGHNLLIAGDSYNRAFRDVLAAHFTDTVYVDYRIMSKINIDTLIEKYNIDTILISGNDEIWTDDAYMFSWLAEPGGGN